MSLVKRFRFTEQKNFELRGEFLNAFNNINFNGLRAASASPELQRPGHSAYTDATRPRIRADA